MTPLSMQGLFVLSTGVCLKLTLSVLWQNHVGLKTSAILVFFNSALQCVLASYNLKLSPVLQGSLGELLLSVGLFDKEERDTRVLSALKGLLEWAKLLSDDMKNRGGVEHEDARMAFNLICEHFLPSMSEGEKPIFGIDTKPYVKCSACGYSPPPVPVVDTCVSVAMDEKIRDLHVLLARHMKPEDVRNIHSCVGGKEECTKTTVYGPPPILVPCTLR